jgi:methionyl-tRNA formyltransferase
MRILYIGLNDFSYHCLQAVIAGGGKVVAILTKKSSDFNADFRDLSPLARKYNIPIYCIKDINSDKSFNIVRKCNPDVIFCFGWSQIIKDRILELPCLGVIGVHPAKLPYNRGRHPLIWALALGLNNSALTFFRMDDGSDTGDIISQRPFKITYEDNAATLYEKIKSLASRQIREFMPKLEKGTIKYIKQNIKLGNWWRRRDEQDGAIDWRMSSWAIYNLVRALTCPYVGAHCYYEGNPIKIWQVREIGLRKANVEPGKVISRKGNRVVVKTYDSAVEILKHDFSNLPKAGEYLR